MKNLLLNGTAIAGLALALSAAPAAAEIELGLGGQFSAYGVYADQDTDNVSDEGILQESEIYFQGKTTLDNGLTVGVEVQLEGESETDIIDESYLYVSGDFGRVNLGSENGAAYLLQVGHTTVDANFDGMDSDFAGVNAPGANSAGFNYGMGVGIGNGDARGDTQKITYLSPVMGGFQAGVSYSPEASEDANIVNGVVTLGAENTVDDFSDEIQVGARWNGEFEGVGVTVGAGYSTADLGTNVGNTLTDDFDSWNIGAQLNVAGVTVGAAYYTDNGAQDNDGDTELYAIGASYDLGAYRVAASYTDTETETGVGTEDEAERIMVGASYAYGPGMTFNGSVQFIEFEDAANVAANEEDATVFVLGTTVKF